MLISWALISLDRIVERRFPRVHRFFSLSLGMEKRMGRRGSRFVTSALTMIIFLSASSLVMREMVVKEILAQKPIHIRFHGNEVKTGIEIGKTREVLFLKSGQEVKAIPLTTLSRSSTPVDAAFAKNRLTAPDYPLFFFARNTRKKENPETLFIRPPVS